MFQQNSIKKSYERQIRAIEHMSQKFNMLQNISL